MMDAVEYLKVYYKICGVVNCNDCPLYKNNNGIGCSCDELKIFHTEIAVRIVEDWWAKNKPMTNAEWVKEKLEEIGYKVDGEKLRHFCPPDKGNLYIYGNCTRTLNGIRCDDCRKYWDEPHEENINV